MCKIWLSSTHFQSLPRVSVSFFAYVTCAKLGLAIIRRKESKVPLLDKSEIHQSLGSTADY